MVPKFSFSLFSLLSLVFAALVSFASAERVLESRSLNPCMANSQFSATYFHVAYTPNNSTLSFDIVGISDISGDVVLELKVFAYGFPVVSKVMNPETNPDLSGLNPMSPGRMDLRSNTPLPKDLASAIPGIAYSVPDLDGQVQIYINDTKTGKPLACVEAQLRNGKTVYQKAVGWVTAVIAGLGLITSAIASGLGHSNTAAHLAANAMSLFGFFQAQAFVGMSSVPLPPIVAAWTQNFQWSMGIIRIGFLQRLATWYQRATGGTPSELLSQLSTISVRVEKRSVEVATALLRRATTSEDDAADSHGPVTVHGITRVGFTALIERTNIFLTGYTFFVIFVMLIVISVVAFKFICEALSKAGRMKSNKFQDFRNGWIIVLKGILFRVVLIGFPQMAVLCFWEMVVKDSAGEVVLAVFTIFTMIALLCWAIYRVWRIARQSEQMHGSPVHTLYSDPVAFNKWGFLHVQFKAAAYYFIAFTLLYILLKGMFIAFAQDSGKTQGVALFVLEGLYFVLVCVKHPYMDKKTNWFNISIAGVNFLNAIFLLIFSRIFSPPAKVTSVMGLIFTLYNVVFASALLLVVLSYSLIGVFSKNPDMKYQPMRDDRDSFIKHPGQASTELSAMGATARGDEPKMIDPQYEEDESSSVGYRAPDVSFAMNSTGPSGNGSGNNLGYSPSSSMNRSNSFQTGVGYQR